MLKYFAFISFVFFLNFNVLLALTQAEQIQKAREEIFNSLENENNMEIEEFIVDEEGKQKSTNPINPPPPKQEEVLIPEPNTAEVEALPKNAEENEAKNLYLSYLNPINRALYVNEVIAMEFKLVVFGNISESQEAISTEFVNENNSVQILNADSPWRTQSDGTLRNIFYLQIKSADYVIPKMRVQLSTDKDKIIAESEELGGQAILLKGNPLFSGVIASQFKLDDYKITNYDTENNLIVFALSSGISNMKDFKIGNYPKQGYESGVVSPEGSSMIYYVVLPKNIEPIVFDYFNLEDFQFHRISISNVPIDDRVSTQSDLKPKRSVSLMQFAVGGGIILFLLIIFVITRSYLSLVAIVLVVAYLIVDLFITDHAKLLPNAEVKILPTFNSTTIIKQEIPLEVEILDKRNGFYKIVTHDGRIGWVRKEETKR